MNDPAPNPNPVSESAVPQSFPDFAGQAESAACLRLTASLPYAIIAWEPDGTIQSWNAAAQAIFGWPADEIVGQPIERILPVSARPDVERVFAELMAGGNPNYSVNENITREGRILLCEWHNILLRDADGKAIGAVSTGRDITREVGVVRERRYLQDIISAVNAGRDLQDILLMIRNAVIEVGGFDRAGVFLVEDKKVFGSWGTDASGKASAYLDVLESLDDWNPRVHDLAAADRPYYLEEWVSNETDIPAGHPPIPHAVIGLRAEETLLGLISVDNLLSGRPVRDEDVIPLLTFAEQAAVAIRNARMVSERARQQARQRRLATLAAAICSSTSLIEILRMVHDAIAGPGGFDRAAVFLHEPERGALRGIWGTDRAGQTIDMTHLEKPDYSIGKENRRPLALVARGELDYYYTPDLSAAFSYPPDHTMYGVRAHVAIPLKAGGRIAGVVCVDNLFTDAPITQDDLEALMLFADQTAIAIHNARLFDSLQKAQEALMRSEKLRAVGELASGVAHNINNILAAVLGYAELIQIEEGAAAEIKHYARTIERAALDGSEIVRRMQRFARREAAYEKERFDLSVIAQEAIELTRPTWHNRAVGRGVTITMQTRLTPDIRTVGAASEIREVIVNLITNAVDAMPSGGTLTLRSDMQDGKARLEVSDTGEGMTEATRRRIFEPFFTTKPAGLGMGLGLAVAWNILRQHEGEIEVQSAPGQGARFRILLPLDPENRIQPAPPAMAGATLSGKRFLLVDDEEFVLGVLARALAARGAGVEIASSAQEAEAWLERHAEACDAILTDHGMAGKTGLALLETARRRYPRIRRILISGWGANLPGDDNDLSAAELILAKPIRQDDLTAALAQLLASP